MPYPTAIRIPVFTPNQYPISVIKNMLNSVTEPPIGSLTILIIDVTTASATAMAEKAICLTPIFLSFSAIIHPIEKSTINTAINAIYPAAVN